MAILKRIKRSIREISILFGLKKDKHLLAEYELVSSKLTIIAKYIILPIFCLLSIKYFSSVVYVGYKLGFTEFIEQVVLQHWLSVSISLLIYSYLFNRIVFKYSKAKLIYLGKHHFLVANTQKNKIYNFEYSAIELVYGSPMFLKDDLIKIEMHNFCEEKPIYFFANFRFFKFWEDHPVVLRLNTLKNKKRI